MKQVTDTLGIARSNIAERVVGRRPKREPQTREGDLVLTAAIRRLVDARPTYGYRRIAALLKRERRSDGLPPVNAKRVYMNRSESASMMLAESRAGTALGNRHQ
jgi:putative transposase